MSDSQESETFACSECASEFKNTEELQEHAVHEHLCSVLKDDNVTINSHEELENWKFEKLKSIYANRRNTDKVKFANKRNNGKGESPASIECQICGKILAHKRNIRKHEILVHKINRPKPKLPQFKCSECQYTFMNAVKFEKHVAIHHREIILKEQSLTFQSEKVFNTWKSEFSKLTFSQYIKYKGYKNSFGEVQMFKCHRSGSFKSRGKGLRDLKISGSNKIGYYCPAAIKVQYSNTEETVNVKVQTTHMGHSFEVERLSFTQQEKEQLVKDLKSGLPVKRILQNISETADPHTKLASTNTQDLRNISSSCGISFSIVRLRNNVLSVDSWVKQIMASENNPILIYKPLEITPDLSDTKDNNFILGFMNDAQEYIFKTYGNDIISVDSTYGPNLCGIQLTSIIVKDENHECIPVAFLWSNQQTEEVFRLFFTSVYKRINQLTNRTFISDDNPAYYNAWKAIFGESKFHLLCSWQVKNTWAKKALFGPTKIEILKKRRNVLKYLRCLANEVNEFDFQHLADSYIPLLLEDDETHKFGEYFVQNYCNREHEWAACFRVGANIKINKAIESWHKDLKHYSGLQIKYGGCLVKVIDCVMKSLQTKLMSKLVPFDKGILKKNILLMRKNHWLAALKLNAITPLLKDENVWTVASFTETDKFYEIRSLQIEPMHKCNLKCEICNTCLHQYCCSCSESAIKYIFCEHIHLLSLKKNLTDSCESSFVEEDYSLDCSSSTVEDVSEDMYLDDKNLADNCVNLFDEENNSVSTVEENVIREQLCLTDSHESLFSMDDISDRNCTSLVEKNAIVKQFCNRINSTIAEKEEARAALIEFFPIFEKCTSSTLFKDVTLTMNKLKRKFEEMAETEKQLP